MCLSNWAELSKMLHFYSLLNERKNGSVAFTGMYFTLSNREPIVQPVGLIWIKTSWLSDFITIVKNTY